MIEHGDGGGDIRVVEAGEGLAETGLAGLLETVEDRLPVRRDRHLTSPAVEGVRGAFDQVLGFQLADLAGDMRRLDHQQGGQIADPADPSTVLQGHQQP